MAGAGGIPIRPQTRRIREVVARHGAGRRRTSKEVLAQLEEENVEMVTSATYSRRSFPLEHESDSWTRDYKKAAKTESSAKQRRTLSEREENSSKSHPVLYRQHESRPVPTQDHSRPMTRAAAKSEALRREHVCQVQFQTFPDTTCSPGQARVRDSELNGNSILSTTVRPLIPEGVVDIDADPDSLTTTVYSREVMEYLLSIESRGLLKPGFLDKSPEVTSRMRGVLMDWLLQVQNHEELEDETLHLCVNLIDRFLSMLDVKMPKLQLVGITCLLIASKFNERFAPEISTLCYLTDNTFVKDQVVHYERFILHHLQFDLASPVCIAFLDRYLQVHQHPPEIEHLARYLLDLSITSVHMVPVLPSLKAASALCLSRRLLLDTSPDWSLALSYYTNYTAEDLGDVINELASLLIKAPDSKFQGARNKYNTGDYSFISYCDRVGPGWVLHKQLTGTANNRAA